ncbi:MAG: rhombosortase [Verrucomicrobiota bacterium]
MIELAATPAVPPVTHSKSARAPFCFELIWFSAILLLVNFPFAGGMLQRQLAFFPSDVASGKWWQVLTHAFVHVSWYHLLLDGSAFLMLYSELQHWSRKERLSVTAIAALSSLSAALLSPIIWAKGFCGLSGVAHGLMAISGLEWLRKETRWAKRLGAALVFLVVAKAGVEAATGQVAFTFLHFGLMGLPVAASHAGGVLGALIFWLLRNSWPTTQAISGVVRGLRSWRSWRSWTRA